jgi:hypothetical protein
MSLKDALHQERIEDEGAWLPMPPEVGGEALISFMGNPEFLAKRQRLEDQWRKQHPAYRTASKPMPSEADEDLTREAMIGTVVKRLRGIPADDSGEEVPDTDDGIRAVLDSRKCRRHIIQYATDEATFLRENLDLIQGNSKAPSGGSSAAGRSPKKTSKD